MLSMVEKYIIKGGRILKHKELTSEERAAMLLYFWSEGLITLHCWECKQVIESNPRLFISCSVVLCCSACQIKLTMCDCKFEDGRCYCQYKEEN